MPSRTTVPAVIATSIAALPQAAPSSGDVDPLVFAPGSRAEGKGVRLDREHPARASTPAHIGGSLFEGLCRVPLRQDDPGLARLGDFRPDLSVGGSTGGNIPARAGGGQRIGVAHLARHLTSCQFASRRAWGKGEGFGRAPAGAGRALRWGGGHAPGRRPSDVAGAARHFRRAAAQRKWHHTGEGRPAESTPCEHRAMLLARRAHESTFARG